MNRFPLLILMCCPVFGAMQIQNNGLDSKGVQLAPAPSSSAFGALAPYAVVLVNATSRPLAGIVVDYNADGIHNKTMLRTNSTDQAMQFAPSQRPVFLPSYSLASAINQGRNTNSPQIATEVQQRLAVFAGAQNVWVSLDSIVWGDTGKLEGPDTDHAYEIWSAQDKADAYMASVVSANTGASLAEALQRIVAQGKTDDPFEAQLWNRAMQYSHSLTTSGEEATKARAAFLTALPKLKLTK